MRNFDDLREQLLRAGIAPRHVRRYLAELRHHHDDLVAEESAHDITGPAANEAATARLGSNGELAAALLAKPELRSVTARLPWLLFGLLPSLAVILALMLLVIGMQLVGIRTGIYIPRYGYHLPVPARFVWIVSGMMFTINFLIVPLSGALLAWVAQRQRMKPFWPLLGMALLLLLGVHGGLKVDAEGRFFRQIGILPITWGGGPAPITHWPTFLAQAALLCLPLAWLWRARHKTAAAQ
jgi:hypothetical protein